MLCIADFLSRRVKNLDNHHTGEAMPEIEPEPAEWTVATLREVAEFWHVKESTIRHWRCENPRMPGEPGKWHLPTIFQWAIEQERRKRPFDETEELLRTPDGDRWKDRWIRAKALLTEEELEQSRGELVSLDEIMPLLWKLVERSRDAIDLLEERYGGPAADVMRLPLERLEEGIREMEAV